MTQNDKTPLRRALPLAAALAAAVAASPVRAGDVMDALALARQADPRFNAARFEFQAAAHAEPIALAGLLPTASIERTDTRTTQNVLNNSNPVYATGRTSYSSNATTLTLVQPLFRVASWWGYEQAKSKVKQAGLTWAAAEQDLMLRLATAYLGVLAAEDALGFAKAERDAIKRQLDLVQERYDRGLVTIVGLHEARARHAIKSADAVAAQNELDDRRQALREITGRQPGPLAPLAENLPLEAPEPDDIEHWVAAAAGRNLLVEARRQAVEVARQEVERQRAAHLPTVDLVYTGARREQGGSLFGGESTIETQDAMVRVTLPLYAGGLPRALTGEAMQRWYLAQEDLERDLRQTERQARAAFQGVTGGIVRAQAFGAGVVSSESARRLRQEGYRAGLDTVLQLLDAERDLYAAKRDAARARYDYLLSRLRLKQAVGTLSDADLEAIDRFATR